MEKEASLANEPKLALAGNVLSFDVFWKWLQGHPNCIVSVGTPEVVLYDHEDFHWHLGSEEGGGLLVQVIRGKNVVGELVLDPSTVAYVQSESKGPEEFLFECVEQADGEVVVAYSFTLSHDYDPGEVAKEGRWVH